MKTLKTISTALSLTLLVSAVSAPAMETLGKCTGAVSKAVSGVVTAVGHQYLNAGNKIGAYVPARVNQAFSTCWVKPYEYHKTTKTLLALGAAAAAYKAYNYFTAEEAEEVADEANEPVQNVVPTPVEVTAPVETPVVEAPKTEVKKAKRNPFAKRTVRRNAPAKAKAPKAKVAAKAKVAKAPKAKVTRNAGCKNGKCGVRRSK